MKSIEAMPETVRRQLYARAMERVEMEFRSDLRSAWNIYQHVLRTEGACLGDETFDRIISMGRLPLVHFSEVYDLMEQRHLLNNS